MKLRSIGSVLAFIVMLAPFLVSYNPAPLAATTRDMVPPSNLGLSTGKTIVVTSAADSGSGTLRQILEDAESGITITFDPDIFPPDSPSTIYLMSGLPDISWGSVIIDASNAGVILDGRNLSEGFVDGLHLTSNDNIIRGLQFLNFEPGSGICLSHGAQNNIIGGDRSIGLGPIGQGNLMSYGDLGINIWGEDTSFNTIVGNLIGTDPTGEEDWGNVGAGIGFSEGVSRNIIGPDNIIAYNNPFGISIAGPNSFGNTIMQNSIHHNEIGAIDLEQGSNNNLPAPMIHYDEMTGTLSGTACANCTIEIFSDSLDEGEIYEGQTEADSSGAFTFNKGAPFTGPNLTATATDDEGNTSEFSAPVSAEQILGATIIVTSAADSGAGTLRQLLEDAMCGDTISFDPIIFPTTAPATIFLTSRLPDISQGYITVDASNAGVILDGSNIRGPTCGLNIVSSCNTIRGLQFLNFGQGILLGGSAQNNIIGGDRAIGSGPIGQGNLISKCGDGIQSGTSYNTISGNLIGTDPTGIEDWGNESIGISIHNGASYNVIGPDNIIAHNGYLGIQIVRDDVNSEWSVGNTITENSIHHNGLAGIELWGENNDRLLAPTILDFDLTSGTVTGATYPNCTVEIFSDSDLQGQAYEGRARADANGVFIFNKGTAFVGPNLTATATDAEGNTSQFSAPTFGTSKTIIFQEGNSLPRIQIQPRVSSELADNRLGGLAPADVQSDWDLEDWLYKVALHCGYKWIRTGFETTFDWPHNIEPTPTQITPLQDEAINTLVDNGVEVIIILSYCSERMAMEGPYYCFKEEEEIELFLEYAQFIVRHFKDRVQYYEIFCEPDLQSYGKPYIEVEDYLNLIRRVVPVIRQEQPEAKIVVPCVSGIWGELARDYLFEVIESDVMPLVDVITWHEGQTSPEYQAGYYYDYESIVQEVKETAYNHGFRGEYFTEEIGYLCPIEPHTVEYAEYGEISSAKYLARGILRGIGMDFKHVGAGTSIETRALLPYPARVVRTMCTIMAGAVPTDLPLVIETLGRNQYFLAGCQPSCGKTQDIKYFSFSLPNGDQLVGLWVDGKADDDYSGIITSLTISGISAQRVTGIDVLYGFEQELITSAEEGNLVISNLLVKDYPIIVRLSH